MRQVYSLPHADGASLIYTSIRNNCNLNLLYEYVLHRAYEMPLRFKAEAINEEAIFIPFGYDKPSLIKYHHAESVTPS